MATIENASAGALVERLRSFDESELLAQQLVQQGAIHCLTYLLTNGCTEALAIEMVASLRVNMETIVGIAQEKGFTRLFSDMPPNFN